MKNKRLYYFMLICVTIILGLVSRQISVPLFVGDVLWAIMIFFMVQFVFIDINIYVLFLASLMICYMVEISQLYQVEWLNNIRSTILGSLVLGQVFMWSDIIAYTVGITIVTLIKGISLKQIEVEKGEGECEKYKKMFKM